MNTNHTLTGEQALMYLERIGYSGSLSCSRQNLDQLILQHQCTVPFENIDIYDLHRKIDLRVENLFQKIVVGHRGGYCHELNSLFYHLLLALGYEARPCMGRVLLGTCDYQNPIEHRANLVRIENELYFCDVGMGGPMPAFAVELSHNRWQTACGESYRINRFDADWFSLYRKTAAAAQGEQIEIMFSDTICYETDFQFINYYMSTQPGTRFVDHRVVNLRTPNGHRSIDDDVYKEKENGKTVTCSISGNLREILKEKFFVEL